MQSAEEAPIVLEQQTGYSGRILRMKVFSPNLKQECILGGWDLEFRHHKTSQRLSENTIF
jgi:hypothetical protein